MARYTPHTGVGKFFRIVGRPSISRNLTVSLAGIICIVVVAMAFFQFTRQSSYKKAEIDLRADRSIAELTDIMALSVWTFDQKAIERIGHVFVQDEDVYEMEVIDEQQRVLFHFARVADPSPAIRRTRAILYNDRQIGEATIVFSLRSLQEELRRLLLATVWYLLGSLVVILVLTGLLLRIFLRKPLLAMRSAMDRVAEGDYTSFEVVQEQELTEIAARFKTMSVKVEARETSLREMNHKLRQEIEEREKAERAFLESEARFREVVEGTDDLVTQVDGRGLFTYVNHKAMSVFGRPPEEMIGTSAFATIHPDDQERTKAHFNRWVTDRVEGATFENRQVNLVTGEVHEMLWTINPHYDEEGDVSFINSIATDITAQKKAEMQRLRLEEQLRQSQKMEALGNLAGGIAHDFNNLLQIMSGYIQLLLMRESRKPGNEDTIKCLNEVGRAADRASELVRRLLTFSRKMEVSLISVNLNEVVTNSVNLLQRTIPKMVSIETILDDNLERIQADPVQIEQVLMNLATNAVDAMEGAGTLTIETENFLVDSLYRSKYLELQTGKYVMITVSDTGTGMGENVRQRMYEPFFTTKELGKGTGLGLSIVYGIVKGHQGHITCYSEAGVGTTFKIYLPANHSEDEGEDDGVQVDVALAGGDETILLVDDEEVVLEIAEELLTTVGYTIQKATSGEEALGILERAADTIDLVIMDLGMPGMGGEKCLREMKTLDPAKPIIVASGYAAHTIAKDPRAYGAAGFLAKPYRLDKMVHKVREVLGSR